MQNTINALVEQTLVACSELAAQLPEYAQCITRKADALRGSPTALNAYNVLSDLRTIAKAAGVWTD